MTQTISIGGTSQAISLPEGLGGMGAVSGFIDGGSCAWGFNEPKDVGAGVMELSGSKHMFLDRDGSWILTSDSGTMWPAPDGKGMIVEMDYTVIDSGGRFEDFRGTWTARGLMDAAGSGPFRHKGQLSK
jgi:hypothetical protein